MTDKLELKSSHEVIDTVDVADVESIFYCKPTDLDILTVLMKDGKRLYCDEVCPVDSIQEVPCNHCQGSNDKEKCDELVFGYNCPIIKKPVSEDLEEAAKNHAAERYRTTRDRDLAEKCKWSFKAGAEWQKEQFEKDYTNLCNGIATVKGLAVAMTYNKGVADTKEQMMKNIWKDAQGDDLPEIDREVIALLDNGKVVFAHRPYKGKYLGKNLTTGNIETFENKTYDKGGWNQPDVKWWLDIEKLPNMEE